MIKLYSQVLIHENCLRAYLRFSVYDWEGPVRAGDYYSLDIIASPFG